MKSELKVELSNSKYLKDIFEKCYFNDENNGRLFNSSEYLILNNDVDDICWSILNNLNNITVKITNPIIDGSCRFILNKKDQTYTCTLYPYFVLKIKINIPFFKKIV